MAAKSLKDTNEDLIHFEGGFVYGKTTVDVAPKRTHQAYLNARLGDDDNKNKRDFTLGDVVVEEVSLWF